MTEKPSPDTLMGTLRTALQHLAPPERVVIRDFEGTEYTLPAGLPARRQVRVFGALAEVLQAGQATLSTPDLTGAGLVQLVVKALGDEGLVEKLGRAFAIAYPSVVGDRDPLDLFPIEEILSSLLPLLLRFLKRSGSWLLDLS